MSNTIVCTYCKTIFDKKDAEKWCSNCFACSGCERYECPNCKEEVIIVPVRKIGRKNNSTLET